MIILDANTIVSVILGTHTRSVLKAALERGLAFGLPQPQLEEAARVLTEKLSMPFLDAAVLLEELLRSIALIPEPAFAGHEAEAKARLHERAISDWPVLAAAMAYDADIWSNDRDFFGVGVAVWSTKNLKFAALASSSRP